MRQTLMKASALIVIPLVTGAVLAAPCDAPGHRSFDFWVGEWQVHTPDGKHVGTNRIAKEYDGCVIHERYTSVLAFKGESLNTYDAGRGVWHQTWVDNAGTLLVLEGGMHDGSMVLEGTVTKDGTTTRHRITWTPGEDGSVRQLWESQDAGGSWSTVFDGRYTRLRGEQ